VYFGYDRVYRTGVELAFEAGDGTEGAGLVAAFGDLDIGMVARPRDDAVCFFVGEIDFWGEGALLFHDQFVYLLIVSYPGKDIDLRHTLLKLFLVAFGEAAAHDEEGVLLALCMEAEDGVDRLLFSSFDEATGIDDDHICMCRFISDLVRLETTKHDLRVHEIFGAAQADEMEGF